MAPTIATDTTTTPGTLTERRTLQKEAKARVGAFATELLETLEVRTRAADTGFN